MKRIIVLLITLVLLLLVIYCLFHKKSSEEKKPLSGENSVKDIDGNIYPIVKVGSQLWMGENLKTTRLNDSTEIQLVSEPSMWSLPENPAYCWYENNPASNKKLCGALYNWYTVNTGKLCPPGWHVPGDYEWQLLERLLGGDSIAGRSLKEAGKSHWVSNSGATNESGFRALPSGYRYIDGLFYDKGLNGTWWTSSETTRTSAWARLVSHSGNSIYRIHYYDKKHGFSVRCIKDSN
jgi:uncharacterized protein (TIGR02145 family)